MASFLVNGLPAAAVAADDRGFLYGDGVFRTLAVRGGLARNWDRHFQLLAHDCGVLGLACPEASLLAEDIARVAPADATVRITVTRGVSGRGYACDPAAATTCVVAAYPAFEDDGAASNGVHVRRCALVLAEQPRLAGAKTLNRLENVLARAEWNDPAVREGLLCDAGGRLIEGTMSNVFIVVAGKLVTPDLRRCGVAGAQRLRVLDIARGEGIACEVRDVGFGELSSASEVFLCNSLIGLWPVVALADRRWAVGPTTRHLQARIDEDDAAFG